MSMVVHRTHWDHYFVQWCLHWLPTLDLHVQGKPQFSQLPLEADILIVTTSPDGSWHHHPLWQHLSPYTIVEFKSVQDPFETKDLGKLMAYVGLTMEKEMLPPETVVAGWLIVPYINRALQRLLQLRHIELMSPVEGVHLGQTGLFPLVIIEYNRLPLEEPFCELKTFMKSGRELRLAMELSLRKWLGSKLYKEYTTIITSIHTQEAQAVIEILEQDKKKFRKMAELMLEKLGDEADSLEFIKKKEFREKLKTARQMKADGLPIEAISRYTGLSVDKIENL
ncbi:MAG: hypothetical protein ACAI44_31550 [Candidatus Sericytochromatia bacterium]